METSLVTNDILYVCQKSLQYNNVYTRRSTELQQTLQEFFLRKMQLLFSNPKYLDAIAWQKPSCSVVGVLTTGFQVEIIETPVFQLLTKVLDTHLKKVEIDNILVFLQTKLNEGQIYSRIETIFQLQFLLKHLHNQKPKEAQGI